MGRIAMIMCAGTACPARPEPTSVGTTRAIRYWSSVATQAAICAREPTPSLFMMLRTWLSTVRSEMNRRAPICLLVSPSATSRATWVP